MIGAHHGGWISLDSGGREEAECCGDDEEDGERGEEEAGGAEQGGDQVEVELPPGDGQAGGEGAQPGLGAEHHQAWPATAESTGS